MYIQSNWAFGLQLRRWRIGLVVACTAVLLLLGLQVASGAQAIPTITVVSVVEGNSVTIETSNYPANQSFVVTMGKMGSRGIDGYKVTDWNSGAGGKQQATFTIPEALKGEALVAIRLQSKDGYFSFNWFYNASTAVPATTSTTTTTTTSTATPTPATATPAPAPAPVFTGTPTFSISAVQRDGTVTIAAKNFPPNQDFKVTMGTFGTRGVNGILVTTTPSGKGGDFTATYDVPANLHGSHQIAIRLESAEGYFAYNWFYNYTTP